LKSPSVPLLQRGKQNTFPSIKRGLKGCVTTPLFAKEGLGEIADCGIKSTVEKYCHSERKVRLRANESQVAVRFFVGTQNDNG